MIVSYDPVAKELSVDPGNGLPAMVIKADRIFVHIYADGGHLGCEVAGSDIDLRFGVVDEEPQAPLLWQVEPNHWRLTFIPRNPT